MAIKLLGCTDNLLVLPVCGIFVSFLGLVLLIIYLVARGITSSLHLVEAPIPTYVAALMTIALGVISIILLKKRHILLICCSILLSVLDLILCIVHAVTAGLVSIPFLGSFSVCVLRATSAECQCYILGEGTTNSTVIVPGDGTKHYTFQDVKSCASIETALKDFLYTLCIAYSFGAFSCVVTGTLSTLLFFNNRRSQKHQAENGDDPPRPAGRARQTVHQEDENRERNTSMRRSLERTGSPVRTASRLRRDSLTQSTPQHTRPPGGGATGSPDSRPVRRSASVTTSPNPGGPIGAAGETSAGSSRPVARVHSVTGASGESGSRQRSRIPILVRGGFLQSHVNGPRIPVYTIQGSHEAYIALTDLPRLQLPALDQVPAYVRDLHALPNYEPPPYSPTAEVLSESPELRVTDPVSDQSPTVRQQLLFEDDNVAAEEDEAELLEHLSSPQLDIPASQDSELVEETDDAVGSIESLIDDQQQNLISSNHSIALGTDDITIHDAVGEMSEEGDLGLVNTGMVVEEDELELVVSDDACQSVDHQPPDILLEAIESARAAASIPESSTSTSATRNILEDCGPTESPLESHSFRLDRSAAIPVDTLHQSALEISSRSAPATSAEQSTSRNQRNRERRTERASRPKHRNLKDNAQGQFLGKEPGNPAPVNNPLYCSTDADVQATMAAGLSHQKENIITKSKEIKRSRSLSTARNQSLERSFQEIPSSTSRKVKRHSATYGRERGHDVGKRAMSYVYAPQERNISVQYSPGDPSGKAGRSQERGGSSGRTMARQTSGTRNSENLSDIISLVETVHHSTGKQSSKPKKKKKSSKTDNVYNSYL